MTAFKMTARHHAAAETLAITGNVDDAAASAGVSARTLRRWREQPAFQTAVDTARRAAYATARHTITATSIAAADALRSIITDPKQPAAARTRAAVAVLNLSAAIDADDLRAYLETLEAKLCDLDRRTSTAESGRSNRA